MEITLKLRKDAPALLEAPATAPFNRYRLCYTAALPVRGCLLYRCAAILRREIFYLETGVNKVFSSYIDDYLTGGSGEEGTVTLLFESINQHSGELTVCDLSFDTEPVYAKDTYFIENRRYRLGIELAWGGGLSYLKDKAGAPEGVENLLNNFDTGRLVQQSYYGTDADPFEAGEFMNRPWCYNPVQGGDRGMYKSKLIETRVSEAEVYVKCRPRDWGQDGGDTYSYMENTYRLQEDSILVTNRFTDFSGWTHPPKTQELPAFYTVSYLGNYYWYGGTRPWSGDTLSCKNDLPFWPTDWGYCSTRYTPENTERWGAFADGEGYGVGLYVPETEKWLHGRAGYDGSKSPGAASCSYIAPTRVLTLKCFEPLTYSYLIATGTLEEIRETFTRRRKDIDNTALATY